MKHEKGQALILIMLAMVALVGLVALAIDGGNTFVARRSAQGAADSAAMAAALKLAQGKSSTEAKTAAMNLVTANGFTNSGGTSITINHPPVESTRYKGNKEYVEVIIHVSTNTYFGGIVGVASTSNTVSAIARGKPAEYGGMFGGNAIIALKPNDNGFTLQGSAKLYTKGGGVFVNSNSSTDAMTMNADMYTESPSTVVGGLRINGKPTLPVGGINTFSGTPYKEPFSEILDKVPAVPSSPGCKGNHNPASSTNGKGETVLQPGIYSGMAISNSKGTRLAGGLYCLTGDMNFNGGSGPLVADGPVQLVLNGGSINLGTVVMDDLEIYTVNNDIRANNSGNSLNVKRFRFYASGSGTIVINGGAFQSENSFIYTKGGQIHWNGNAAINLKAPPAGDKFAGLAIYMPWENQQQFIINGGNAFKVVGTILVPHAGIQLNGNAGFEALSSQLIGYTVRIDGNIPTYVNYKEDENFIQPQPPTVEFVE